MRPTIEPRFFSFGAVPRPLSPGFGPWGGPGFFRFGGLKRSAALRTVPDSARPSRYRTRTHGLLAHP